MDDSLRVEARNIRRLLILSQFLYYFYSHMLVLLHFLNLTFHCCVHIFQIQRAVSSGPMMLQPTTITLQMVIRDDPRSDILLEDIPSLDASHSHCHVLEKCPTTIKHQVYSICYLE